MCEFINSLCITGATFKTDKMNEEFIDFTTKIIIDNQEKIMAFSFMLKCNSNGEKVPSYVIALGEKTLDEVSEEEYQFRMKIKAYRNELFERLKQENSIRLHTLFL